MLYISWVFDRAKFLLKNHLLKQTLTVHLQFTYTYSSLAVHLQFFIRRTLYSSKPYKYYASYNTNCTNKHNDILLTNPLYRIVTGTCLLLVCKREYTNEIKHWFLIDFSLQVCFSCNKFLTDLFWVTTLLGSEQSSKCSSTKTAFYGEACVKVTSNHFLCIIIHWIFL